MNSSHSLSQRLAAVEGRQPPRRAKTHEGDPHGALCRALGAREPTERRVCYGTYFVTVTDDPGVPAETLIAGLARRITSGALIPNDLRVLEAVDAELAGTSYDARSFVQAAAIVHDLF